MFHTRAIPPIQNIVYLYPPPTSFPGLVPPPAVLLPIHEVPDTFTRHNAIQTQSELDIKLYQAIRAKKVTEAKRLIAEGASLYRPAGFHKANAIHQLGYHRDLSALKLVFQKLNGDPNTLDLKGQSLLHYAVLSNRPDTLVFMLEEAKANVEAKNLRGLTPLALAAHRGATDFVKQLAQTYHADVNATDHLGQTPLHHAIYKKNLPMISLLVNDLNASLEQKNAVGQTPLQQAKVSKFPEVIQLLEVAQKKRQSHAGTAQEPQQLETIQSADSEAERAEASETKAPANPFQKATPIRNWSQTMRNLAQQEDENQNTLLHWAAEQGKVTLVQTLLQDFNADPNRRNKDGKTPFQVAPESNRTQLDWLYTLNIWRKADEREKRAIGLPQ